MFLTLMVIGLVGLVVMAIPAFAHGHAALSGHGVAHGGIAHGIGQADDFVALVVMPEDHETVAERLLGVRDPRDELAFGREGVVVRQRSLETQHLLPPR